MVCADRFPQSCFPFLASPKLQAIAEKSETPQALGRLCSVCWYVASKLFWTGEASLCFHAVWCCAVTAGNWRNQQAAWGTCFCLCSVLMRWICIRETSVSCHLSFIWFVQTGSLKAVFPFLHLQNWRQLLQKAKRLRHLVICVLCVDMLLQSCFGLVKDHCAFMLCDVVL